MESRVNWANRSSFSCPSSFSAEVNQHRGGPSRGRRAGPCWNVLPLPSVPVECGWLSLSMRFRFEGQVLGSPLRS